MNLDALRELIEFHRSTARHFKADSHLIFSCIL